MVSRCISEDGGVLGRPQAEQREYGMRSQGMGSWSPGVGLWAEEEVRGCGRTHLRLGGHPRALFPTKLGQTLQPTEGVSVFTTQQGSDRGWGSSESCLLGNHG